MVTGSPHLNLLAAAGWNVNAEQDRGGVCTVYADCSPLTVVASAPNRDVAERMVVAACLVADGHDPVRLLADAYLVLGDDHQGLRARVLRCLLVQDPDREAAA